MTPNEHLLEAARQLAAALEGAIEPPAPTFPESPVALKPWCGNCNDRRHRELISDEGPIKRCPDCHPFPNPKPSTSPCRFCGVPVHWGPTIHGHNGWIEEEPSPGCAYSPIEFEHQPLR